MQPFISSSTDTYRHEVWPELIIRYNSNHLLIEYATGHHFKVLSSAVWNGGFKELKRFVNWQVPLDFDCTRPEEAMREQCAKWGYEEAATLGMQTAAYIEQAAVVAESCGAFRLLTLATVGLRNRARAGFVEQTFDAYHPGTINLLVFIDGILHEAAFTNAVITATEAKSAALQDMRIVDDSERMCTGTTTDSIAIAATGRGTFSHRYAGTATKLGDALARSVYEAVSEAAGIRTN